MTVSLPFDHLMARAIILWPERVGSGIWRASELVSNRKFDSRAFDKHIRASLAAETQPISSTDVCAAYESFLRRHETLVDWYAALFSCSGVQVDWNDRCPTIVLSGTGAWLKLCNEFEPDVLLAFHLAWKKIDIRDPAVVIATLSNWRTIPRAADHELAVLWSRGVSDMHVHAGGVRIPQDAWLEIMCSSRALIAFEALRGSGQQINEARAAREKLTKMLFGATERPECPRPRGDQWWSWQSSNLSRERELLLAAWRRLSPSADCDDELARTLDRYIFHKNLFFATARQPAFKAVPGLRYFADRFYRIAARSQKRLGRKPPLLRLMAASRRKARSETPVPYGSSKRLEMAHLGDACQYLAETAGLRRVELRIQPFDRAVEYRRFFKAWKELKRQFDEALGVARTPVDIRFAVHFKRTRSGSGCGMRSHTKTRLTELDKQSAALRVALACREENDGLEALQRVDVAGNERDTALAAFSWHLRLLRGCPEAIHAVENDLVPPPWNAHLKCWKRLMERGLHRGTPLLGHLGTTVHAGEDFIDVLDGIYQVGAALDLCKLSAGDGVGHALALVAEKESVALTANFATMPLGEALDQLCWLRSSAANFIALSDLHTEGARMDAAIKRAAQALYSQDSQDLARRATAQDHVWLWETKVGRRRQWKEECKDDQLRKDLLDLESGEAFWALRDRFEPFEPREDLAGIVQRARTWLLERFCHERVVVEMNPSSNLRISGASSSADNPTVALLKAMAKGLQGCINTDNPGVFVSCIENEYALLLDGLSEKHTNPAEIRELLEKARRVGMEYLR